MRKARTAPRFPFAGLVAACALAAGLQGCGPPPSKPSRPPAPTPAPEPPPPIAEAPPPAPDRGEEVCEVGLPAAAMINGENERSLAFAPFRRPEIGWETYAPLVAQELGTECAADSPAFAGDLAAWQYGHHLHPTGILDIQTFAAMSAVWQGRRPFVALSVRDCPPPPAETNLAPVPAKEAYGGKIMQLRPAALAAYERMLAAARAEVPEVGADPQLMTIFSAYRSPDDDDARCELDGNCQGIVRASCSPHRTGLAVDLNLGAAPGFKPDASDDPNRLWISRGAAYRWMAANAHRFGFAPYPFEPWHWEWTGEPI